MALTILIYISDMLGIFARCVPLEAPSQGQHAEFGGSSVGR